MRHPMAELKIMPNYHGACMDVTKEHAEIASPKSQQRERRQ
jgi:hypothetical protein